MSVPPLVPRVPDPPPPPRSGRHSKGGPVRSARGAATAALHRLADLPRRRAILALISLLVIAAVAAATAGLAEVATPIGLAQLEPASDTSAIGTYSHHPVVISLPARPESYLGLFARGVPDSYAPVTAVTSATGTRPNLLLYYSGWYERFKDEFAVQVQQHGAVPFIQLDPNSISLAAIAAGTYDAFLQEFATQVAAFGAHTGHGVIISFAHEMNGSWYHWGYRHTSPRVFVAAWRHLVTLFRQQGADDVTWLWTTNIIDAKGGIPNPAPWWPGQKYVTWIGIDGYYYRPSWTFASLFGPTIKAVRALTTAPVPILIAETGAARAAGQPAKIANLSAGVQAYGLLGFVWFDADGVKDWSLHGPAAIAAFHQAAAMYDRAAP
jgi:mannan endo-1,4-beta-mannosidase